MSKKHKGGPNPALQDTQSTTDIEQGTDMNIESTNQEIQEPLEGAEIPAEQLEGEPERLETLPKVTTTMGIGQFVRHLLLKSAKTNAEILELVAKHFPESKTTAACIAWHKSDLRKKGLLEGGKSRGSVKIIELSEQDLAELIK